MITKTLLISWFTALYLVPAANAASSCVLETQCFRRMIEIDGEQVWRNVCSGINEWTDEDRASPDLQISFCVVAIQSSNYSANNLARAFPFNQRGVAYYAKREYDRAIADFSVAIQIHPRYVIAYINRGNSYDRKGEYVSAIEDYSKAIEIDPQYALAYNNRGNSYKKKHDYDQAIADFDEAIRLSSQDAVAFHNRAITYAYKGQYDRAIDDLRQVLSIDPSNRWAKDNLNGLGAAQ
jgi:tetratricopeptide (TPR) repeat protein